MRFPPRFWLVPLPPDAAVDAVPFAWGVTFILVPLEWMPAAYSGWLGDASRDELAVRLVVVVGVVVVVVLVCPDVKWSAFPVELVRVCRNRIDRIRLCAWELLLWLWLLWLLWELVPVEVDGPPPSIIVQYRSRLWPGPPGLCGAVLNLLLILLAEEDCEKGRERKGNENTNGGGRCVSMSLRIRFCREEAMPTNERNGG